MKLVTSHYLLGLSVICSSISYSAEIPPIITCGPDMETLSPEEIQQNIAGLDFHEIQSIKVQSGLSDLEWKKINGEFSELELLAGSLEYDTPKTIPVRKEDNPFSLSFENKLPVPKTPIDQSFLSDFDSFMQGKIDIETLLDGRHCIFEVGASISCVSEGLFGTYDNPSALDEYNILSGKKNSFLSLTTVSYEQLGLSSEDVLALEKTISTGMIARFVKDRPCIVKTDAVYCQMSAEERSHPSAERLKPNRDGWFKVPGTSGSDGNVTSGPEILSRADRMKLLIGGEELGERAKFQGEAPGRCYGCHDPAKKITPKREWTLGTVERAAYERAGKKTATFTIIGTFMGAAVFKGNSEMAAKAGGYVGLYGGLLGLAEGALESVIWQRGDEKNVILLPSDHPNVGDRQDGVDYEESEEARNDNANEDSSNNEHDSNSKAEANKESADENTSESGETEIEVDNGDNSLDTNEPDFDVEEICMANDEHTGCNFDPTMDNSPKVKNVFCRPRLTPISNVETFDPNSELYLDHAKEMDSLRDLLKAIKDNPRVINNPDGLPIGTVDSVNINKSQGGGSPRLDPAICALDFSNCIL